MTFNEHFLAHGDIFWLSPNVMPDDEEDGNDFLITLKGDEKQRIAITKGYKGNAGWHFGDLGFEEIAAWARFPSPYSGKD